MEICLTHPRFRGMFWAQFFGALNDNVFKNALVILVLYHGWTVGNLPANEFAVMAGIVFIAPFLLFSAWGGQLADRMSKDTLVRILKNAEIAIALLALAGLLTGQSPVLLVALFGFATHSALFGPVKYAILPDLLEPEELLSGNAVVESGTSLAILLGTMIGGILAAYSPASVAVAVLAIALAGRIAAIFIPSVRPQGESFNRSWWSANREALSLTWQTTPMLLTVLGVSWFWLFGAVCLTLLPIYSREVLNGTEGVTTLLLAAFSVGVGIGSQLCEKLSAGRMELGWVPLGSLGMTVFCLDLGLQDFSSSAQLGPWELLHSLAALRIVFDLAGIAVSSGLFIVPLYTFIQKRSADETRSRLVAGNSLWNSVFIIAGTAAVFVAVEQQVTLPKIFVSLAILNTLVAVAAYRKLPEFVLRLYVVLICKVFYSLKVKNSKNVPQEGPCVIVANHVTLVDWLFLASGTDRPVRFVMIHTYYNLPIVHYLFKDGGAIPIGSGRSHPELLKQAFESIHQALLNDEMVIIFPEGKLTSDGQVDDFKRGIEKILERDPVPVLPMGLKGLWGTRWSKAKGRRFHFRPSIELVVGEVSPPEGLTAEILRDRVLELLR